MSSLVEALLACRGLIAPHAKPEQAYGFFPGGDYDPRRFHPDPENSPAELAAHKAACEAWERGERPTVARCGRDVPAMPDGAGGMTAPIVGVAIVRGSAFGMGTYEYFDRETARVLSLVDDALRAEGVEVPA